MRTHVKYGVLGIATTMLALACGENGQKPPPREPTSASATYDPAPQRAFNDPSMSPSPNATSPSMMPPPGDQRASTIDPPTTQSPVDQQRPEKTFGAGATTPENRVLAKTEKPLTDAEVIAVAITANDGEVQMAEVAIKKATAADVKQFAGMMKSQHSAALQKIKTLQSKTKLMSTPSELSTYLENDASTVMKDLRSKEGVAFDKAYMESQVKAHKDVLAAIDNRLMPSTSNGEVKTLVTEMRRTVSDHLVKAEDIQGKMDPSASMKGPGGATMGLGMPEPMDKPATQPAGKHDMPKAAKPDAPANGKR